MKSLPTPETKDAFPRFVNNANTSAGNSQAEASPASNIQTTIIKNIESGKSTVGIIGLGFVGLPLGLVFAESGIETLGFDVDSQKIEALRSGTSYIRHIPEERVSNARQTDRFIPTSDFTDISRCGAVIICVPTPLDQHLQPDLRFIEATCRSIAPHLSRDTLVILQSTTWPGTTEEVLQPILEKFSKYRLGDGLLIAYSPEREDPGNGNFSTKTIPRLVGGLDSASLETAATLYRLALDQVVEVGEARVAEAAKLFENIFRSVNIALVNELKIILDSMGIDVWEVIKAAATKPFGFMPFWPGPGLGGHCIPIDPFYLSWKAKEFAINTRFIELAGEINRQMPMWVIRKIQDCLNQWGKAVKGSRILILGLAYKANVDDMRESPSFELMDELIAMGADVAYNDPYIPVIPPTREHSIYAGWHSVNPDRSFDCLVLATAHGDYVPTTLLQFDTPVVDTRNLFPDHELVVRA